MSKEEEEEGREGEKEREGQRGREDRRKREKRQRDREMSVFDKLTIRCQRQASGAL